MTSTWWLKPKLRNNGDHKYYDFDIFGLADPSKSIIPAQKKVKIKFSNGQEKVVKWLMSKEETIVSDHGKNCELPMFTCNIEGMKKDILFSEVEIDFNEWKLKYPQHQ